MKNPIELIVIGSGVLFAAFIFTLAVVG